MIEILLGLIVTFSGVFLAFYLTNQSEGKKKKRAQEELAEKLNGVLVSALKNLRSCTHEIDTEYSEFGAPTVVLDLGGLEFFRREIPAETVEPKLLDDLNELIGKALSLNRHMEVIGQINAAHRGGKAPYSKIIEALGDKKRRVHNLAGEILNTLGVQY